MPYGLSTGSKCIDAGNPGRSVKRHAKVLFRVQKHQLLLFSFGGLPRCGLDSEARACILLPLCARSYLSSLSLPWKLRDSTPRGCSEEERHSHPEKHVEGLAHYSCSRELHQGTLPGWDSSHWSLLISALLLFVLFCHENEVFHLSQLL